MQAAAEGAHATVTGVQQAGDAALQELHEQQVLPMVWIENRNAFRKGFKTV